MGYGAIVDPADGARALSILRSGLAATTSPDPERLVRLIIAHGLVGLVDEAASRSKVPPAAPLGERLRLMAAAQEARVFLMLTAAAELGAALERAGVRHVFVKGVAMALSAYERPGLRSFADLDVLVSPSQLEAAQRALAAAGFARDVTLPNRMQVHYWRPRHGLMVDLHWDFTQSDSLLGPVRLPVDGILSRARRAGGVWIPCTEDSLLLAGANFVRCCAATFILVVDFDRLAAMTPDWDAVVSRAAAGGLKTCVWLGLRLAREHLEARVPEGVLQALEPPEWRARWIMRLMNMRDFWRLSRSRDVRYRFLLKLLCLDRPRHVMRAVVSAPIGALRKFGLIGASPP